MVADEARGQAPRRLRVAVMGKGGVGKSLIAGTLARTLAQRGRVVLAISADPMGGLPLALGHGRDVHGLGESGPDGVRLVDIRRPGREGLPAFTGVSSSLAHAAFKLVRRRAFRRWTVVGDFMAGPVPAAFDWAPYAEVVLVVSEPTWPAVLSARRIAQTLRQRGGVRILQVANKVAEGEDIGLLEERLGEPIFGCVPLDLEVMQADRLGASLLDHAPRSPTARAIEALADRLAPPEARAP